MVTEHDWFENWKKSSPNNYWSEFKVDAQEISINRVMSIGGTLMKLGNFSKIPVKGSHGVDDDPLTRREALRQYVLGRNLAVRIGCDANPFTEKNIIVDFEGKHGKHEVYWDTMPDWMIRAADSTMCVETPTGGFHLYYRISHLYKDSVKRCVSVVVEKMSKIQKASPFIVTYGLIPYSRILLSGKKHVYMWKNDLEPMPFDAFVEGIP